MWRGFVAIHVTDAPGWRYAADTAHSLSTSLQRTPGDSGRIAAWSRVFGRVLPGPELPRQPPAINGLSDLILERFGAQVGGRGRSAVARAARPFDTPVAIETEAVLVQTRDRHRLTPRAE